MKEHTYDKRLEPVSKVLWSMLWSENVEETI